MQEHVEDECALCGAKGVDCRPTDHGNRLFVSCVAPGCGRYEISRRALKFIADGRDRAQKLRAYVAHNTSDSQYTEIIIDAEGTLVATPVCDDEAHEHDSARANAGDGAWHFTDVAVVDDAFLADLKRVAR